MSKLKKERCLYVCWKWQWVFYDRNGFCQKLEIVFLFSPEMLRSLKCFTIATSSWRSKTRLCRTPSATWRKGHPPLYQHVRDCWIEVLLKVCVSRLRSSECDGCSTLKEDLKNSQDQNLRLLTKLSEFTRFYRFCCWILFFKTAVYRKRTFILIRCFRYQGKIFDYINEEEVWLCDLFSENERKSLEDENRKLQTELQKARMSR